jgi:hypothetical protein
VPILFKTRNRAEFRGWPHNAFSLSPVPYAPFPVLNSVVPFPYSLLPTRNSLTPTPDSLLTFSRDRDTILRCYDETIRRKQIILTQPPDVSADGCGGFTGTGGWRRFRVLCDVCGLAKREALVTFRSATQNKAPGFPPYPDAPSLTRGPRATTQNPQSLEPAQSVLLK